MKMDLDLLKLIEYWNNGLRCADILMKLALDLDGAENDALIRATRGLNAGLGGSRNLCGALTGSCCVFGYFAESNEDLKLFIQKFLDWFKEKTIPLCGSMDCKDIIGNIGGCPRLVLDCYSKTMEILGENEAFYAN
jgi:hypothetical protein